MTSVQEAIAQAQAAAQNQVTQAAQAAGAGTSTAVAPVAHSGVPMSMDTMAQTTSLMPDLWLKVMEFGLRLGLDNALHETLDVEIDLSRVQAALGVRYGNPPIYKKTYDNTTTVTGEPWGQALQEARMVDPKAQPYPLADIPMFLAAKVKGKDQEFAAGTYVGHSTAPTNWREWIRFWNECKAQELTDSRVKVQLGYKEAKNRAGNKWGLLTFKLLGPVEVH